MRAHLDQREVRRIFEACCLARSPEERAGILDKECIDNPDLLKAVDELFDADVACESFLESSPDGFLSAAIDNDLQLTKAIDSDRNLAGTSIGSYKLLQQIGEGGFGVTKIRKGRLGQRY